MISQQTSVRIHQQKFMQGYLERMLENFEDFKTTSLEQEYLR